MKTITIFTTLFLLPLFVFSQEAKKDNEISKTIDLTEVTVKAEKVERKLQEIPVAVSVIKLKKIENENIGTLADLSARVPNLFVLDYGSKLSPPVFIRGMGLRRDASPSVGLYVDNIPYMEKGSFNFDFVDVESIEVLRGPQGTLYGRNTMGGLIKIYTQEPKAKAVNYFKTEFGNYGLMKTSLHLNQPLSSKFYTVFNAMYSRGDGYFINTFNNKKADQFDSFSTRFKLAYRPNNNFKATFSIDFENSNELGYPYALYSVGTQTANPVNYNRESSYDRDQLSMGLNIEHKAKNFVFSSSTSFQLLDDQFQIDQDFSPVDLYFIDQQRLHHTFYQEFNIHSRKDSKIDWLVGAMFFKQSTNKDVDVLYGDPFIAILHLPYDTYSYIKSYDQPTTGYAVYGQTTIPFGKFDFTAGARLDFEKADLNYGHVTYPNGNAVDQPGFESDLSFSQFVPKVSLAYKPCQSFSSYFSVTKGFKAGGFNSSFESDDTRTFNPEYSWNYEFGFKSTWFDNHLTANVSVFLIDIKDQQVLQPVPTGRGSFVSNAAKSRNKGFEVELNGVINKNWQVWASYGYIEAKFLEYTNTKGADLTGKFMPNIPFFTFNAGTNFTFELKGDFIQKMHLNLNYQLIGKQYWEETNEAFQKNYGIANMKITFENKVFDIGFWAKNIFDVDYNSFYFVASGKSFVQLGKPAQFGVFAKIKF